MFRDPEIRAVCYDAVLICGIVFLSTITRNWAFLALSAYGVAVAAEQKLGKSICVYLLIAFLPAVNLMLMPRYGHFAMISRFSTLLITTALILAAGTRHGRHQIPLGSIFLYLAVAVFSSMFGYFPLISYLKILNFIIFILGIYIGTRNINLRTADIDEIRHMILAIVLLLTYGSLLLIPFPSISYFTSLQNDVRNYGTGFADEVFAAGGKMFLFAGVGTTSQFTGPTCACLFAWLLCDMWLVKKRLSPFHLALMAPIPLICYMSRSRLALFVLILAIVLPTLTCLPRARVARKIKSAFIAFAVLGIFFLVAISTVAEIRSGTMSKWLRKQHDISSDDRNLGQAITGSRQGPIAVNMRDFRRNRLLGSGFQVAADMRERYNAGQVSIFSASVEKGLIPLMILGETGILGGIAFSIFLLVFYLSCAHNRYTATATLFTVYLATNMAEATFFSPSGTGGTLWILLVVGGFIIDVRQFVPPKLPMAIYNPPPEFDNPAPHFETSSSPFRDEDFGDEVVDIPEEAPVSC